jgi:hypothetical protein
MELVEGTGGSRPVVPITIILGSLAFLTLSIVAGLPVKVVAPIICLVILLAATYRVALSWTSLVSLVIGVILFIPIRRYVLPINLPFNLEPYRFVVMLIAAGWLVSLLVDPRVRTRSTGFRAPLLLFTFAALGSIVANPSLVASVGAHVIKQLSYFASFVIVVALIVSVVRTHAQLDAVVKVIVGCGSVVAFFALVQAKTGYNVFDHLTTFLPFLKVGYIPQSPPRGGRLRAYASAQHAIELGAMLVMLVPLAGYLVRRTAKKRWVGCIALLLMGALASLSRTSMLMLVVVVVTFLFLRPKQVRRLWPALIPLLAAVHIALPGTIGTLKDSFFPKGGLVAEQTRGGVGSGRVASLGPALERFKREPVLGQGFGTRITEGVGANAPILDDQWLSTLVETGVVGFVAWLWVILRAIKRFGGAARRDRGDLGWLLASITAAVAALGVAMATFDAFGFTQVTLVLFIELALGTVALRLHQARTSPKD